MRPYDRALVSRRLVLAMEAANRALAETPPRPTEAEVLALSRAILSLADALNGIAEAVR